MLRQKVFTATLGHKHSMFENDTNVIQIRFSSAVSMTTSVVCTGLQLQDGTFKTFRTHYKSMYCHQKC